MIANKIREQIINYKSFKDNIKCIMNKDIITKTNSYFFTTKKEISNWKSFYLYDKSMFTDNFEWEEWGYKIEYNKYAENPSIQFLTNFNIVKEKIKEKNKIYLIDKNFAKNFCSFNLVDINCYIGFNKYILEFDNGSDGWGLICKIGKKNSTKYIIIENIKFPVYKLIQYIMKEKEDILVSNKFNYRNMKLKKLVVDIDNIKEKEEQNKKNFIINDGNNDNLIYDSILKVIILLFGLNKEIKDKMNSKIKKMEKYYLINSEWMKQFKNKFNYQEVYNYLLQYTKYSTFSQFESNLDYLFENIKNSNIIPKNKYTLKDISVTIFPEKEKLKDNFMNHYIKYYIINYKIKELIKEIMNFQNINYDDLPFYNFYLGSKYICKGENFFEIGYLDLQEVFISKYFILFNKKGYIDNELNQLIKMNNIKNYFILRNIETKTKEIQNLNILNEKIGLVFNLKFLPLKTRYNSFIKDRIQNNYENKKINKNWNRKEIIIKFLLKNNKRIKNKKKSKNKIKKKKKIFIIYLFYFKFLLFKIFFMEATIKFLYFKL